MPSFNTSPTGRASSSTTIRDCCWIAVGSAVPAVQQRDARARCARSRRRVDRRPRRGVPQPATCRCCGGPGHRRCRSISARGSSATGSCSKPRVRHGRRSAGARIRRACRPTIRRSSIEPVEDAVDAGDLEPRALRFVRRAASVWRRVRRSRVAIGLGARSPFRHFLARVNGEPAATCSLFLGAGVAGIYDVRHAAGARAGAASAALVTRAAMQEARARGYRMAILHSSALGAGMYRGAWLPGRLPDRPARVGAAGFHAMTLAGRVRQHRHLRLRSAAARPHRARHARLRCRLRRRAQSRLPAAPGLRRLRQRRRLERDRAGDGAMAASLAPELRSTSASSRSSRRRFPMPTPTS